jgi:sterol desaturase/sphingolipid hydroxylase (fatty acid hydroxylase superfamily)
MSFLQILLTSCKAMFPSLLLWTPIRVQLPWLDRILVTPQVHRIHHSIEPQHYNQNFADALPIFDILFGTYHPPDKDFPVTGLGVEFPAPDSLWSAQIGPLLVARNLLTPKRWRRTLASSA